MTVLEIKKEERPQLMDCLLNMGQLLLGCGAEISRVEDTIIRMGHAYGAAHVEAFVITSIISLSMEFPDDETLTDTRRIYSSSATDFYQLEDLNELSRECCTGGVPIPELQQELQKITREKKPLWKILVGGILGAGGFTAFFGGSLLDSLTAVIFALLICFLQRKMESTRINTVGENLLIGLLVGVLVELLGFVIPQLHMDKILIGDIMLLIPGLAMTNSIRNILVGNTISGIVRLIESLIWAAALAGGFMTAMLLVGLLK